MEWLNEITRENFADSFNLEKILKNSVFYPAAGVDGKAIEGLSHLSNSFVHVDYSTPREIVEQGLIEDFKGLGYQLIGLRHISKEKLTPNGFKPHFFHLKESEKERMHRQNNSIQNFTPFALWAVYELDGAQTHKTESKTKRFSILHIGGEATATFDALYVGNGINPLAVAIISPGEGYGDNWTKFRDPDYRFYKLIRYNVENNNQNMPKYLFTNMSISNNTCFWPNYEHLEYNEILDCNLFQFDEAN